MEAAAAISSLILFSIQSAKVIYQVLHTINVGHDKVTQAVAIKVNKLRYDLERFEKCPAGRDQNSPGLKELMENCSTTLEGMREKLQKFQLISSDKLPIKLWKSFRSATSDSELKKFQADVESFSLQLSAHLGISTNEKVFEVGDRADEHHATILQEFTSLHARLGELKGTGVDSTSPSQRFEIPNNQTSYAGFDNFLMSPSPGNVMPSIITQCEQKLIINLAIAVCRWTSELIDRNSQTLEKYFDQNRLRLECSTTPSVGLQTLIWLQEWSQADSSSGSWWLQGPPGMSRDLDNQMTQISAKLVELAGRANVHMISYFCRRVTSGEMGNMQALSSLLYALLRQIILQVPLQLHLASKFDFSENRFKQLDGTGEGWTTAISIFRELTAIMPQIEAVFCVLDGFHWVDKIENRELIEEFLSIFRAERLNILFVTTGRSEYLMRTVKGKRNLDIEFVPGGQVDLGKSGGRIWDARKF